MVELQLGLWVQPRPNPFIDEMGIAKTNQTRKLKDQAEQWPNHLGSEWIDGSKFNELVSARFTQVDGSNSKCGLNPKPNPFIIRLEMSPSKVKILPTRALHFQELRVWTCHPYLQLGQVGMRRPLSSLSLIYVPNKEINIWNKSSMS